MGYGLMRNGKGGQMKKGQRGDKNPNWKGGKKVVLCDTCGKELSRYPSHIHERKFCDSCKGKWRSYDMVGKRVGILTVIKQSGRDKHDHILWQCLCDCGITKDYNTSDLGIVKSCGCLNHPKGEKSIHWKGGKIEVECSYCGKKKEVPANQIKAYRKHFCYETNCMGQWMAENLKGESHPRWVERFSVDCAYCGKALSLTKYEKDAYDYHFCKGTDCYDKFRSENQTGDRNSNWQGGKSFEPYPIEFNNSLKRKIMERDNYQCQNPQCIKTSEISNIHHIDYDKDECHPNNLITLCGSCHSQTNGNREYWKIFYSDLLSRQGKLIDDYRSFGTQLDAIMQVSKPAQLSLEFMNA